MGLNTKIYWLTDRQSQCNFDFLTLTNELREEFCMGDCEDRTWAYEAEESPLLEVVARERLLKTQQAERGLVVAIVTFQLWR
jgi:hypothetical protein